MNTFVWQYIAVPQNEMHSVQQEFRKKLPDNTAYFQNISLDITHFLGLELDYCVLIQVPPMGGLENDTIHTDIIEPHRLPFALNIPLENCDESITKFWKAKKPIAVQDTPEGVPYNHCKEEDCDQISELKFVHPFIFNTGVHHSVSNPAAGWRRGISLRFIEDPRILLEKYGSLGQPVYVDI